MQVMLSNFNFQALYYWLRTYLLERRDVANKSELGRLAMAQQQRVHQNAAGSLGMTDGIVRMQNHGAMASENQSATGVPHHDGGNSNGQESERSGAAEGSVHSGNDPHGQQSSSSVHDSGQNLLRRSNALSLVASAASAFDSAKDIMEALRSKHTNLAGELEVKLLNLGLFTLFVMLIMQGLLGYMLSLVLKEE